MLTTPPPIVVKERPTVFSGDEQALFDRVVTHLFAQGRPSRMSDTDVRFLREHNQSAAVCYYRLDGMECAVGTLITDDDYTEQMEGKSVDEVIAVFGDRPSIAALTFKDPLLGNLQSAHDNSDVWHTPALVGLLDMLVNLARCHKLNETVLRQVYADYVERTQQHLMTLEDDEP